jgi:hypothetical protein
VFMISRSHMISTRSRTLVPTSGHPPGQVLSLTKWRPHNSDWSEPGLARWQLRPPLPLPPPRSTGTERRRRRGRCCYVTQGCGKSWAGRTASVAQF